MPRRSPTCDSAAEGEAGRAKGERGPYRMCCAKHQKTRTENFGQHCCWDSCLFDTQILAYMLGKHVVDLCVSRHRLLLGGLRIDADIVAGPGAEKQAAFARELPDQLLSLHSAIAFS